MYDKKLVTQTLKPDENTTLAKLSIVDMLRLLISKISNNDVAELDANERLTREQLKVKASLMQLIDKATLPIIRGDQRSVTLQLSSEYLPYIDEVFDEHRGKGQFFNFDVQRKDLPSGVKHKFIVRVSKKMGGV